MTVRARHLENMAKVDGKVLCTGGLLDREGNMKGSLLVMEFESRERLDAYLKSEPYILEGVWQKIDVDPMNVVILNGEKIGT